MKRSINRLLPILLAGMFVYAGCAKQEVVKKDESLVPAVEKPAGTASLKKDALTAEIPDKPIATSNEKSVPISSGQQNQAMTADLQKAFEKIYFDFDSSTLSDTARQKLARNFAVLKQNTPARIRVEGHCDERGSDEYNLALGERRAQAAVRYLITMGVPADRLSTISYGKEKPADQGHNESSWAKNRRDEFLIAN